MKDGPGLGRSTHWPTGMAWPAGTWIVPLEGGSDGGDGEGSAVGLGGTVGVGAGAGSGGCCTGSGGVTVTVALVPSA